MPEITELESKIIDLVMEGKEKTKIAKELGIARSWLYKILYKEHVVAELEARREQLRKSAKDKITGQVNNLTDEMISLAKNSTDQRVKYNAIKYLLDRALGTPVAAKEENNINENKDKNKDANTLKKELDDIKNLKVVGK